MVYLPDIGRSRPRNKYFRQKVPVFRAKTGISRSDGFERDCIRHHAVLRKDGFLAPAEMSLNFPRLWRVQRRESQSLWPERAVVARKSLSGLWPRQTLSRRETAARFLREFKARVLRTFVRRIFPVLGGAVPLATQNSRMRSGTVSALGWPACPGSRGGGTK